MRHQKRVEHVYNSIPKTAIYFWLEQKKGKFINVVHRTHHRFANILL